MTLGTKPSIASRLRAEADKLQSRIDIAFRPMTQNLTPKRNRELQQRHHDGINFEATQRALRAMADAHDAGAISYWLSHFVRASQIAPLVRRKLIQSDYYHVGTGDYADTSSLAKLLQAMIGAAPIDALESARREVGRLENECRLSNIPGYFPTPADVAARMAALANLRPGCTVLEPSAGSGRLIDAVLNIEPTAVVEAIEQQPELVKLLYAKQCPRSFKLTQADFLGCDLCTEVQFDAIVMNPPFENSADAKHVLHAYHKYLKPGGRLVAIISRGTLTRSFGASVELQAMLQGQPEILPPGTFDDTGVSAAIIVLDKPFHSPLLTGAAN
ncbi:MAG TPA: methyltransferase [Tepidisphaeraceae bacterium]|jgi:protein-L-isoaspartate O-methyltransferase|nr:methyltransferase [Tepidisphaeraceae bacterium]